MLKNLISKQEKREKKARKTENKERAVWFVYRIYEEEENCPHNNHVLFTRKYFVEFVTVS